MQKNKSIVIRNGVGVKQYALMEQCNSKYRPNMEDTSFIHDCYLQNCAKSVLFGVFDGHGGSFVSSYLEKYLPAIAKDYYKSNKNNLKAGIEKMFLQINEKIKETISKSDQSGSTGTLGLIFIQQSKRVLYIGHVGDSLAYVFDDLTSQKLTAQHRCDNPQQANRIRKQGGMIIHNRVCGILAVTRAFGDFGFTSNGVTAQPQVRRVQLRLSHKYIVVASDGLWDFVDLKRIHKIIKDEIEAGDICRVLVKTAIQSGSGDNVTVLVLRL